MACLRRGLGIDHFKINRGDNFLACDITHLAGEKNLQPGSSLAAINREARPGIRAGTRNSMGKRGNFDKPSEPNEVHTTESATLLWQRGIDPVNLGSDRIPGLKRVPGCTSLKP